jgi:G3E family GTPase
LFSDPKLSQLNWVVIETTGLADPAPLIQSLYMDPTCKKHLRLDSVLTVVDVKHIELHIQSEKSGERGIHGGSMEAIQQICFADRIILNKIDLVDRDRVQQVADIIKRTNPSATIIESTFSKVPVEDLLNIRAFDASRNITLLEKSTADVTTPVFIKTDKDGKIVLNSYSNTNRSANLTKVTTSISTISLTSTRPIDLDKFNMWITRYLQENGPQIFRVKGVVYAYFSTKTGIYPTQFYFRDITYERI